MSIKYGFCVSLFRGRKKKITILFIILILLINAMIYVSLELFKTMNTKRRKKDSWLPSIQFNGESYLDPKSHMRVIVGHYVGGSTGANLTDEEINTNHYAPELGAGADGRPVQLTQRELIKAQDTFSLHAYNILVGDKIAINRSLPDVRSKSCKSIQYDVSDLPTASVIIVFHNEAWSTLMRTVMSVLMRSPDPLLKEIVLIDDASERRYLGKELDDAILGLSKVRLLRSSTRSGIVGARSMGARTASGDVLIFLDAHCEVTQGWIEPLLDRAGNDDVFICPQIDLINQDTFAYTKSVDAHWGAFSWTLHFRWLVPSDKIMKVKALSPSKPYPTPAMAGGLFAVRKSLFWRLGGYDEGMRVWGGENLELSWRAWQCGARVEITACSRVGHLFRQRSPYTYPGGVYQVLNSNLARAATVWMDEWAEFFFKFNSEAASLRDMQAVADRIHLRKNLKCKSFEWYLNTVWPQHYFPTDERWFGRIRNYRGACIGLRSSSPGVGGQAYAIQCGYNDDLGYLVVFTKSGQIMTDNGLCLEPVNYMGFMLAYWQTCNEKRSAQRWIQKGPRIITITGACLTMDFFNHKEGIGYPLACFACVETEKCQKWEFERVPWK